MIINIRVPDEAVKQMGIILLNNFICVFPDDCENCKNIIGCECLKTLQGCCINNNDISNYVCEVAFNEE